MTGIRWADWIHAGDTVVDVGANTGSYTKAFLAAGAKVIAFEPDPDVAKRCRDSYPDADVRAQAVGVQCGASTLYRGGANTQSSRWSGNVTKGNGEIDVPVTRLDCALKGQTIHGLKIDAQGDDGWVLTGAQQTLSRMPKGSWVLFELWPQGLRSAGFPMEGLDVALQGWMVVAHGKGYSETTLSLSQIVADATNWREGKHTNVLLRKGN